MNRISTLRGSRRLAVTAILALAASATLAPAAVLDEVPSSALVVFKVNHLQDTSKKLGEMLQALGVTDFVPQASDPLGALQTQSNMTSGIDKAGDAAVVMLDGDWSKIGPEHPENKPPLLVLIPVTDYQSFLNNLDVNKTEDGITMARPKTPDQSGDYVYAVQWGNFAAVSPMREALTQKPDGLKPDPMALRELTDKDATLFVNLPPVKAKLLPALEKNREQIIAQVEKGMAGMHPNSDAAAPSPDSTSPQAADANKMPLLRSAINQSISVVEEAVTGEQSQTLGLTVSKAGLGGTFLTEFMPDSFWGKLMMAVKPADKPLLSGLPALKYLFFGGFTGDPKLSAQAFDHVVGPFRKEAGDEGDQGKAVVNALDNTRDALTAVTRTSSGWVAPTTPVGQGGLFQFVSISKSDDAAKLLEMQKKQYGMQQDLMKSLGMPNADMMGMKVTPDARTVDGISFTQFTTQMNVNGQTPGAMQAQQMMNIFYGPNGLTLNSGVVDPQTLLVTAGGDDTFMSGAISAAKKDEDLIGPTDPIKLVDAQLPSSRTGAVYLPLDAIVGTAVTYARQFGFATPVQLPPNLPPIGFSFGTEASAVRVDGFVPTPLVQSLFQAGAQIYMQMHGGGNGGAAAPGGGL